MIRYELRYRYYHYSTGHMDNGYFTDALKFNDLPAAQRHDSMLARLLQPDHDDQLHVYCDRELNLGGYITKLLGIWKIEETLL